MSGSAGLAAAKRRRAGPSAITNEAPKRPSNLPSNQQQSIQQQLVQQQSVPMNIANTHPLVILAQHEQQLSRINADIDELRNTQENTVHAKQPSNVDEQSIHFFKSKYEDMTKELDEMKKLLIKIQTFSMETNLELLKMKRILKTDTKMKDVEEPDTSGIEKLSLNETN
jgi:hypothetical protein